MKEALISIKPKWCELIASGKKTVEVRKTRPKIETPFKCYIYCTKPSKKYQTISGGMVLNDDELFKLPNGKIKYGNSIELMGYDDYSEDNFLNGKVIGEFVCDYILETTLDSYGSHEYHISDDDLNASCLNANDLWGYGNGKTLYCWHISDLVIYGKPKRLEDFKYFCNDCIAHIFGKSCEDCGENKIVHSPQSWCYVQGYNESSSKRDEALLGSVCKRLFTIFPMKPDDFCSYGESAGRGHE